MRQKPDNVSTAFQAVLERCEGSFRYYLENYLYTRDEHDHRKPVKKFPRHPYIGFLADEFQHGPALFYIAKSRQMMVSWLLAAYTLWHVQFGAYRTALFQSKKEEDAAKMIYKDALLIGRVSFMTQKLPRWLQVCRLESGIYEPMGRLENVFSNGKLVLPNGSKAQALAQGAEQVESWVPSLFVNDEASLQEEWASAQAAAAPALEGGGRGVTVGTMRMPSDYGEEVQTCALVDPDNVSRGIARFVTVSEVPAIRLHYSADPGKDPKTAQGQAWRASATRKMVGGEAGYRWQQHMEINPKSISGTIVLPPTQNDRAWGKIVIPALSFDQMVAKRWVFDSGFDYGARNKTVWLVFAMSPEGKRYLVHELSVPGKDVGGIPGIARLMHESKLLEKVNGRIFADPTVLHNADQNSPGGLVTKADLFAEYGIYMQKAPGKGQQADDVLLGRLLGHYWDGWWEDGFAPIFHIFDTCVATIEAWPMIRYQDYTEGIRAQREHKEAMEQKFANEWDAAKYAESAWPQVPTYSAPAPEGTLRWYMNRAKALDAPGGDLYSRAR